MTKPTPSGSSPFARFFQNQQLQAACLVIIAIVFYANTFSHGYALDDGLVIHENPYTQQGLAGLGDIFSKDAYAWYYEQAGAEAELAGGRYRPLSIATHAIEYAFFGENPQVSHVINVLLYALCGVVLFLLLHKYWLPKQPRLAFLASLLFIILPIHTEAVANIKGRDEILSFLLLFTSLYLLFKNPKLIWAGAGVYFLALLTKENGITFLAVIPVALMLFRRYPLSRAVQATIPFLLAAVAYLGLRFAVVGFGSGMMNDVMNDPYLYANPSQALATKLVVLLKYLQLQAWPANLSFDYGFATFAYHSLSDPEVWISLFVHIGIFATGIWAWKRYPVLSFACLFYLFTLSIISNLVVNIGATMGERLIFLSSFGFVLFVAWLAMRIYRMIGGGGKAAWFVGFALVVTLASGFRTIDRNQDWRGNRALFIGDVEKVPNSIKANNAAAGALVNRFVDTGDSTLLYQGLEYYQRAEQIYPIRQDSFERRLFLYDNWLNQGWINYTLGHIEQAEAAWAKAYSIKPRHPKILEYRRILVAYYLGKASELAQTNLQAAVPLYEKAAYYGPNNAEAWYNLGGATYTAGNYIRAKQAFQRTLEIDPNHQQAREGLDAVNQMLGGS